MGLHNRSSHLATFVGKAAAPSEIFWAPFWAYQNESEQIGIELKLLQHEQHPSLNSVDDDDDDETGCSMTRPLMTVPLRIGWLRVILNCWFSKIGRDWKIELGVCNKKTSCREESQDFQVEYDSLYFPPQPVQGWRWVQDGVSRTRFRYKMSHQFFCYLGGR